MTEERANADLYEPFVETASQDPQKSGASGGGTIVSTEGFDVLAGRQPSLPPIQVRNTHGTWKIIIDPKGELGPLVTQGVDVDPDWLAESAPPSFRVPGAHADDEIIRKYMIDQFAAVMKRNFEHMEWEPVSVGTVSMAHDLAYFRNKAMIGVALPSDYITMGGGTIDQ